MFDTLFAFFYNEGVKKSLQLTKARVASRMENKIKEYRESSGFSQGKLAEMCNVSRQTINAIENNKYDPSLQLAFDIARTLGVTMEEIFMPENGGKRNG